MQTASICRFHNKKGGFIIKDKAAIYCRLSEEDNDKKNKSDDSMSIQNQKNMLLEYAANHNWIVYDIYSDDDYSGSDRNRPQFNRMIEDAKAKKFNIVLCKTQSRFTRELEIVEKYINYYFPIWGIRFVSIVDNIDTDIAGNKKARQINGLVNEWYLEDTSDSIKAGLKARMTCGYYIGAFPPYGYNKDPNQKGHLIIDEEEAEVVRTIFNLYNSGIGRTQIARILNERCIPSPSEHKKRRGIVKNVNSKFTDNIWKYAAVSNILNNEVYIGNLVQGKTYNPTYKSKHTIPAPKNHWIRVENTHDAIIDRETWNLTRLIWESRAKPCYAPSEKDVNVFSGKLICMHCGYRLNTGYNRGKRFFRCPTHKFNKNSCHGATIFESTLKARVLDEFKKNLEQYLNEETVENGVDINNDDADKLENLRKSLEEIDKKYSECDNCIKNLYLDKLKGIIGEDTFISLSTQFQSDKDKLLLRRGRVEADILHFEEIMNNSESKHEIIRKYLSFDEFTKTMADILIDKIEIGGSRDNRIINIYWNF